MINKNTYLLVFLLFGCTIINAQRAKQRVVYFHQWHFPSLAVDPSFKTYAVDKLDDAENVEKLSLRIDDEVYDEYDQTLNFEKSKLIANSLENYFNLNAFRYNMDKDAEADLKFILGTDKFEFLITAKKLKGQDSDEEPRYKGALIFNSPVKLTVLDKNKNNIFTKVIDEELLIGEVMVKDKAPITDRRVAVKAMFDELVANQRSYFTKAQERYNQYLYRVATFAKEKLDFYREQSNKGVFYKIGKKKGYDVEAVNQSIDAIEEFEKLADSEGYNDKLREMLMEKINFWNAEQAKYDESDSKEKKIKWALLANIVGAYTVLNEYDLALEFYGYSEDINYKEKFLPGVINMGQSRKELFSLHHDADGKPYRNYAEVSFGKTNEIIRKNKNLENDGYRDGYVITKDNDSIAGKVQIKSGEKHRSSGGIMSLDFDSGMGESVKLIVVNSKGKKRIKTFSAKKSDKLVIGEDIYESVKFKEGGMGGNDGLDIGKMALAGAHNKFVLLLYKSEYIALYSHGKEFVLKKTGVDKGYSTSSPGFVMNFDKKLVKLFGDCDDISDRILGGEFNNNEEDLLIFVDEYTNCRSE
ncbi:hypothetical protein ACJRPK_17015 [Aquimarina sp. 2-A2]|uniref:hypothetical protein n=1 Tax=Aquimarina sp. 2-A2 TaxID=3382644 RepID=UPI00387EED11